MKNERNRYRATAIVSTYNAEEFIRGRMDDLLQQSLGRELEIVIVNSGSPQDEDAIIRNEYLPDHPNIVYIRTEQRETIYAAWNRAIRSSTSPYITNANTDDRLHPEAIERLTETLDRQPACAMAYADQFLVTEKNVPFLQSRSRERLRWPAFSRYALLSRYIAGPQPLWRSSLHFKEGLWFDESYEVAGDYDFLCRVGLRHPLIKVDQVLGTYYRSELGKNKEFQEPERTFKETYAIKEKYARQYLESLGEEGLRAEYRDLRYATAVPKVMYAVVHRFLDVCAPQHQIAPRMFRYWMLSIIEELRGDHEQALWYASQYRSVPTGAIMRERYERLRGKNR